MISLLASIAGFLGSLIPDIIKYLYDARDKKHEIELFKLQTKNADKIRDARLEEVSYGADISESKALYQTYNTNITWVDALNGTVRPVLAYSFFILYALIKCLQFSYLFENGINTKSLLELWSEEDQAIFAGIISFYYGQRAITKIRNKK